MTGNKRNAIRRVFLSLAGALMLSGVAAEGALAMADPQGHEPRAGADERPADRAVGGPVHWLAVSDDGGVVTAGLDERHVGGRVGWVLIPEQDD